MDSQQIPLSAIRAHADNARPRPATGKRAVAELARSIRKNGLLQPLVVTEIAQDEYRLLAGHRRHAALLALGHDSAPCVLVEANGDDGLAVLLSDNAHHEPVDPLLEADAARKLVLRLGDRAHPQDRAAAMLGKSVAWVRARLRLTTLSESWRKAYTDTEHPISQFPVGHLETIAALSESVQERAFEQWNGWWDEGVPLKEDIRRMVAEFTCDLGDVPWSLEDPEVIESAPACSACPRRDSAQGDLFGDVGGIRKAKGDRCLDAACFEAKRRAFVYARIEEAKGKYGDKLTLEVPWTYRDVPMPEGLKAYGEHELTPVTKTKGGKPVLRLRTMKVRYMAPASRTHSGSSGTGIQPLQKDGKPRPKSIEERRQVLHKRRLVRALDILHGSLMNRNVSVGTAKHPEELVPPEPKPPSLNELITYVLVYGTGPSVDPDRDGYDAYLRENDEELASLAAETSETSKRAAMRTRARLWNRVREPMARSLRTFSGMSLSAAENMTSTAKRICDAASMDWDEQFFAIAVEQIPEPASWVKLVPASD